MAKNKYPFELFGSVVNLCRVDENLSLRQAAKKLGISATYLCLLENGEIKPSLKIINMVCNSYNIPDEFDSFCALARILPPDVEKIIFNQPHKYFKKIRQLAEPICKK